MNLALGKNAMSSKKTHFGPEILHQNFIWGTIKNYEALIVCNNICSMLCYCNILVPPISLGVTKTENGHTENPSASIIIIIAPFASSPEYTA